MTQLTIDLKQLRHNFGVIQQKLKAATKIIAVVKANAYGLGAKKIGQELIALGADWLAVAYAHEGIALRKAGITSPILVFYPQFEGIPSLIDHQLEPVIYSQALRQEVEKQLRLRNLKSYPVHLKCNTGLNRIGMAPEEIVAFFPQNKKEVLQIKSVYSHLGASENPRPCAFTQRQIDLFIDVKKTIEHLSDCPPLFHLLNTSGVFNYPEWQMDAVRIGIGMYGFANKNEWNESLEPIASLTSKIVQIHDLNPGESVGYNLGYTAKVKKRIAVLPVGHADGITRNYGQEKGQVYLHGKAAPIVGNVCMDMLMIDVTHIPCQLHDSAVFFDAIYHADDLAKQGGTIVYELLTGLNERIPKKYI